MIRGIGLDVCQISRMEETMTRARFLARFFSEEEQAYVAGRGKLAASSAAGIYAAKEAFVKALGTGFTDTELSDIAVVHDSFGAPRYDLRGKARDNASKRGVTALFLSITHDGDIAAAVCVLEGEAIG